MGLKINFETVNGNDLQPRITSAIQSGSGPDIIMLFNNHPQIYSESVVDLSEIASSVGKAEGGYYDLCKSNTVDGQKSIALPWTIVGAMIAYRKSWFDEVGSPTFPDTWEKYREVGKKLKATGRPIGQTLGHTFGDAPTFSYPYMWSWGGTEIEKDGKTVNINKKEVIDSVKFMTAFWKEAHDEGGLAWDDTNNNRAFLSQTICATLNGASIYIELLRNPDKYITEKGAQLKTDIQHAPLPKGPAGQFAMHTFFSHVIPNYSKNQSRCEGVSEVDPHQGELRALVRLPEGFCDASDARVGEAQIVGRGQGHGSLQGRRPARPDARLSPARIGQEARRSAHQIHHYRHVRQSSPGHAGGGCREVGARRTHEGLCLKVRSLRSVRQQGGCRMPGASR